MLLDRLNPIATRARWSTYATYLPSTLNHRLRVSVVIVASVFNSAFSHNSQFRLYKQLVPVSLGIDHATHTPRLRQVMAMGPWIDTLPFRRQSASDSEVGGNGKPRKCFKNCGSWEIEIMITQNRTQAIQDSFQGTSPKQHLHQIYTNSIWSETVPRNGRSL